MKRILLGTLAYIAVTFVTQGLSHFAINRAHYAAISFMRAEPVFALGILSMMIQGAILSYLYPFYARGSTQVSRGLAYGLLVGAFFVSYPALAEAAKFPVPALLPWIAVEGGTGLVQFGLFGLLLGLLHRKAAPAAAAA
jgi:hypothetical protein